MKKWSRRRVYGRDGRVERGMVMAYCGGLVVNDDIMPRGSRVLSDLEHCVPNLV